MYFLLGIASFGLFGQYLLIIVSVFFIIFSYLLIKKQKFIIPITSNFYVLVMFCLSYTVISSINGNSSYILFVCPILAYYSGMMIYNLCKGDYKYITKCITAIAIGFFAHAMLNLSFNIGSSDRNIMDFWTKSSLAATLQATLVTMILSMFFYTIFCMKSIWKKIFLISCMLLSLLYLSLIATRTPIVIWSVVTIVAVIFYMILNNKLKKHLKILVIIGALIITMIYMYNNNTFGLKVIVEESNLFARLNESETLKSDESRLETQVLAIDSILKNPLGTKDYIGDLKYAHNMWLDLAKEVGIIPFILLIIYTINIIASVLKIIRNNNINKDYKILISSIYIGMLINFLVEPILQGIPFYFLMFVIINGLIDMQANDIKRTREKNEKVYIEEKKQLMI